jgi:hypothetical protein
METGLADRVVVSPGNSSAKAPPPADRPMLADNRLPPLRATAARGGSHGGRARVRRRPRIIQTVVKRGYRLAYEPERASNHDGTWRY